MHLKFKITRKYALRKIYCKFINLNLKHTIAYTKNWFMLFVRIGKGRGVGLQFFRVGLQQGARTPSIQKILPLSYPPSPIGEDGG